MFSKIQRIRKMSADEISKRCGERIRLLQDRTALRFRSSQPSVDFGHVTRACAVLLPGASPEEIRRLKNESPETYAALEASTLSAAEDVMGGSVELLGQMVPVRSPDWHKDPLSDYRWPEVFFGDVRIYELPADVKYVWEISRHQYLPVLGQAWAMTGDERFAGRVQETLRSWIDANPLYRGVNWTSALEVAIRSMSWIWAIGALESWRHWETDSSDRLSASLADHATFLYHHLSYYSSPYNHLVGEASALYMLSYVLAKHPSAARWQRRASSVLASRGPQQFYEDGFTVEQATGYHFFTVGFLVQAVLAGRQMGQPIIELERSIEKAAVAGSILRRPDGKWPCIGDLDSARSIPVPVTDLWDFGGVCALAANAFANEKVGAPFAHRVSESYWLLGTKGVHWLESLTSDSTPARGILPTSGYACWTSDEDDWALLGCGPVGDGVHADSTPSVAHGHDDALSLYAAIRGNNVLHDSGMLRYAGTRDWVDYLRSEQAHNRIVIDGISGMENAGRLAWRNVTQETEISAKFFNDVAFMRGELRLSEGVRIERNVMLRSGIGIWVADFIDLDQPRKVQWRWHLPAEASPVQVNSSATRCASFELRSWCSQSFESTVVSPIDGDPQAWHAPGYGVKTKSRLVNLQIPRGETEVMMLTHFGDPDVDVDLKVGSSDLGLAKAKSMRLPRTGRGTDSLIWHVRGSVQESYRIDPTNQENGDNVQGDQQLNVRRLHRERV